MNDDRISKAVFYRQLTEGARLQEGQKKISKTV